MTNTLYKWLNADMTTGYQKKPWPVEPGIWTPNEVPVICQSGWHACYEKDVVAHLPGVGASLYEVEVRGKVVEGSDKISAESMRIKWYIGTATEQNLRLFAADCAEDVLPIFYKVSPNDNRPAEAIRIARLYAYGEATDEQLRTAWAAAWDAARAAAWAAAWDAAWDAARDAARDESAKDFNALVYDCFSDYLL